MELFPFIKHRMNIHFTVVHTAISFVNSSIIIIINGNSGSRTSTAAAGVTAVNAHQSLLFTGENLKFRKCVPHSKYSTVSRIYE